MRGKAYSASFMVIALIMSLGICLFAGGCSPKDVSSFDIPGGPAHLTLKEFARQANVEIVFDARRLEKVMTKPVSGRLEHRKALEKMLEGTPFSIGKDRSTGAFAVTPTNNP